jgi:hypothetical protein
MCSTITDRALLGAVQRGEMDKVLEVARDFLNYQNPYWNSFHYPEHLAGWLLTNFHCPYCCSGTDLLHERIPARRAHTDHLLPQKKYPALRDHSMMNAVASCDVCNCMKGDWDPNGDDPIYFGGELTYETRLALIERTRSKLCSMDRPTANRTLDMESVRLAADQAREKLA